MPRSDTNGGWDHEYEVQLNASKLIRILLKLMMMMMFTAQEWSWHTLIGCKFKYFSKRQIFFVLCYENL